MYYNPNFNKPKIDNQRCLDILHVNAKAQDDPLG